MQFGNRIGANIFNVLKAVLFPAKCLVCGEFYQPSEYVAETIANLPDGCKPATPEYTGLAFRHLLTPLLCPRCIKGLMPVRSPFCTCCGIMFKSEETDEHLCADCISAPKKFRMARAAAVYDQALMEVIHCFKYKGKIQLAKPLGGLLLLAFIGFWPADRVDLIVPVPLHSARFRKRGFNQAYLLVRDWKLLASMFGIEVPDIMIERHVLQRLKPTASQTGLDRRLRLRNIKNAFGVYGAEKIKNRSILLIDDVYTTGSTVNECARELMAAGAKDVDVLTLARAM